ncbi:MAG: bacillithiol biosynthesis deacetylase BshB1 [Cryomorphaceae bacterium BACL29 MAG-121220-bin8]|jgi:N-acetylglucosamine malate deacetylase 1|nr:MAG: bacillithiol biosynthesis deacetylase BshB1 [Cryomorphaceae bacterium BACL29 MAG-121220-bin8]|tara:strand:- start:49883 stop:50608 length:726 start_codon:yes stop_codon:yes gene_type:complete
MKEIKLDILAFGAHPDDIELGCGGTLAKEIALGKKVGIIDLTRGELGTRGSVETRNKESQAATKILGVSIRENLDFRDGFFLNDEIHQMEVIRYIRKYKPEIILCNAQDDRHIDHPKGANLVSDSCFLSGLSKIKTEFNGLNQSEWRPKNIYHYIQWKNSSPDFLVDISEFIDIKLGAIKAYSSQFYNPNSKEPETLISKKNFLNDVINRSADLGRLIGVNNAEGFTSRKLIGVKRLDSLI